MRRSFLPFLIVLPALLFTQLQVPLEAPASKANDAKLPGARRVVDASEYASIQAALDDLPMDGGALRLPPGTFEIREPLQLSAEDVLIEGSGTATHIKNVNRQGKPAFVIEAPEGKTSIWRIRLANFRITGNPNSGDGIVARSVDELFIDGVTSSYHGGHGLLLDGCYEDPRICDSLIT